MESAKDVFCLDLATLGQFVPPVLCAQRWILGWLRYPWTEASVRSPPIAGSRDKALLLGAQIIGHWQSQVAKRIDIFATALHLGMAVEEINDLDLSYTPPLSSPWDPVQLASQDWCREARAA